MPMHAYPPGEVQRRFFEWMKTSPEKFLQRVHTWNAYAEARDAVPPGTYSNNPYELRHGHEMAQASFLDLLEKLESESILS